VSCASNSSKTFRANGSAALSESMLSQDLQKRRELLRDRLTNISQRIDSNSKNWRSDVSAGTPSCSKVSEACSTAFKLPKRPSSVNKTPPSFSFQSDLLVSQEKTGAVYGNESEQHDKQPSEFEYNELLSSIKAAEKKQKQAPLPRKRSAQLANFPSSAVGHSRKDSLRRNEVDLDSSAMFFDPSGNEVQCVDRMINPISDYDELTVGKREFPGSRLVRRITTQETAASTTSSEEGRGYDDALDAESLSMDIGCEATESHLSWGCSRNAEVVSDLVCSHSGANHATVGRREGGKSDYVSSKKKDTPSENLVAAMGSSGHTSFWPVELFLGWSSAGGKESRMSDVRYAAWDSDVFVETLKIQIDDALRHSPVVLRESNCGSLRVDGGDESVLADLTEVPPLCFTTRWGNIEVSNGGDFNLCFVNDRQHEEIRSKFVVESCWKRFKWEVTAKQRDGEAAGVNTTVQEFQNCSELPSSLIPKYNFAIFLARVLKQSMPRLVLSDATGVYSLFFSQPDAKTSLGRSTKRCGKRQKPCPDFVAELSPQVFQSVRGVSITGTSITFCARSSKYSVVLRKKTLAALAAVGNDAQRCLGVSQAIGDQPQRVGDALRQLKDACLSQEGIFQAWRVTHARHLKAQKIHLKAQCAANRRLRDLLQQENNLTQQFDCEGGKSAPPPLLEFAQVRRKAALGVFPVVVLE